MNEKEFADSKEKFSKVVKTKKFVLKTQDDKLKLQGKESILNQLSQTLIVYSNNIIDQTICSFPATNLEVVFQNLYLLYNTSFL